jgi:tRNA nucleotidyltransferase (CCA-adding enzyme)
MDAKEFTPNKVERAKLKKEVKSFLKKFKKIDGMKFMVGGSYAKNTWLPNNQDIDIFAKFNYNKYKDKDLSKELKKILSKHYKVDLVHGSRDYFHIKRDNVILEIVPIFDIKKPSEAKNVTDVSPLHVKYIKTKTNKKIQNEIRLLKQFCKANELYGAESYIRGFSGYVLEVLMVHYKSFDKLINEVKKWKEKVVLDPSKSYKSEREIINELNESKKVSPLILIDPVQPNRNAAAALGKKVFSKFISLAKVYDGSEDYFKRKEVKLSDLKGYIILEVVPKTGKKDIVGAKIVKTLERLKTKLEASDFEVKDYGWKWEKKAHFWFKVDKIKSKTKKHYGPEKKFKKHLELFKKKWKDYKISESKGKIYVTLERKFTNPREFLKEEIKKKFITENIKKINIL